jgi:hypothetical protein
MGRSPAASIRPAVNGPLTQVSFAGFGPAILVQYQPFRATSTIRELMQSIVAPSAQGLWDSVGRVSDAEGTRDLEPRSDAEWAAVRRHAVSLIESTNLLLIRGRHVAREGQQTLKADDAVPDTEPSRVRVVHARCGRQERRRTARKQR